MGIRGARLTEEATRTADDVVTRLADLRHVHVRAKAQFGGYGLYELGTMFAIVDSAGDLFLRAIKETADKFEDQGGCRHGKMPYWLVPVSVADSDDMLREWARAALELAREMKR